MAKNNKPRIPLNRKSIHEIKAENTKNSKTDSILDRQEESNPFSQLNLESEDSIDAEQSNSSDIDTIDNPFSDTDLFSKQENLLEGETSSENPFTAEEEVYAEEDKNDSFKNDLILEPPTPNLDLIIDPNMPYFFVFGNSTAGKSAMLSGLLYYIQTSRIGQLRSLSLNDQDHHRKGDYVLSQMTKKVRDGKFIAGTQTLDTTEFVFPTEINLEFEPDGKESMPFCLLEMAGEDLREIELRNQGKAGGNFDQRISAYLTHPDCNMIFICVVDVDTPGNSEDLINDFLRYIYKVGHTDNPVLVTVNKWDKVANQYDDVKDYLEKKLPILTNNLFDDNRTMAYMPFSIGDVKSGLDNEDTYNFNPKDSKKLLEWMYETAIGQSLSEKSEISILDKIKNFFSK